MKTNLLTVLVLGLAVMNSACSTDTVGSDQVKPESIYESYDVSYYQDTNDTNAQAQFRVGGSTGTTLELMAPSIVKLNDSQMKRDNFLGLGTKYLKHLKGYKSQVKFSYTNAYGDIYNNSVNILPASLKHYDSTVEMGKSYSVTAEAHGLQRGESIDAYLCQTTGESRVCANGHSNSTSVVFNNTELGKLKVGTAELYIVRSNSQQGESAIVYARYVSKTVIVNVVQ